MLKSFACSRSLSTVSLPASSFDVAIFGFADPAVYSLSSDALARILASLAPSATFLLAEPVSTAPGRVEGLRTADELSSALRLSGFTDVVNLETRGLTAKEKEAAQKLWSIGSPESDVAVAHVSMPVPLASRSFTPCKPYL
jgi:hypothetical protein